VCRVAWEVLVLRGEAGGTAGADGAVAHRTSAHSAGVGPRGVGAEMRVGSNSRLNTLLRNEGTPLLVPKVNSLPVRVCGRVVRPIPTCTSEGTTREGAREVAKEVGDGVSL
jgi:hypothetical protein